MLYLARKIIKELNTSDLALDTLRNTQTHTPNQCRSPSSSCVRMMSGQGSTDTFDNC